MDKHKTRKAPTRPQWTKKQIAHNQCRFCRDEAEFNRAWYSIYPGLRRSLGAMELSLLIDSTYVAWRRRQAMIAHDIRVQLAPEGGRGKTVKVAS